MGYGQREQAQRAAVGRRQGLLTTLAVLIGAVEVPVLGLLGSGCARPSAGTVDAAEDPALLQEVIHQQEQRVGRAREEVAQVEHELRMVRMRRRLLERAGRSDLAAALDYEERALEARLTNVQKALADAEAALVIYRHSIQAAGGSS